jgi:hypothetical protein
VHFNILKFQSVNEEIKRCENALKNRAVKSPV